jgi:hypothetical protein
MPRVILALATETDDRFGIWDRLKMIQPNMFAVGPVEIKFAYFGREGALQTTRPYIATNWVTTADDMADVMDRGRAGCVCGCYVQVSDILEQALHETRQAPIQVVAIVGDHFHGDLDAAVAIARQLRVAGARLFLLQQGCSDHRTEHAFKALAEANGGAYVQFNPHVERVAERLPSILEAVTHLAIGGVDALAARDDEGAVLLLEQLEAGRAKIGELK